MGFWDDDGKDDERMWNFLVFKFWGTDEEMNEASPVLVVVALVVIVVVIGLIFLFS